MGPVVLWAGRPFRIWIGDEIPKAIPQSYPGRSIFDFYALRWGEEGEGRGGEGMGWGGAGRSRVQASEIAIDGIG